MPGLSYPAVWQTFHTPWSARATGLVWPILAISVVACDHVTPSPPNTPTPTLPTVTTVAITGLPTTFTVGQTAQLTASVTLPDGTHLNATSQVTWQSSATAVVTVSGAGLLTVIAPGEADVTATLQGVRVVAHVVIAKPPPLVPTYDISGVVHESAPTESLLLSGVTVGIHFAGCPTCSHEGQETTTDDEGRFTLPGIETAGFTLWARKPGYEATSFNIAMLPRDQNPSIGMPPTFALVSVALAGRTSTCIRGGNPYYCYRDYTFPVHHKGTVNVQHCDNTSFEDYNLDFLRGDTLIARSACAPSLAPWSWQVESGMVYTLRSWGWLNSSFTVVFTHPN